jgi:nickel-dependent lactate racemase
MRIILPYGLKKVEFELEELKLLKIITPADVKPYESSDKEIVRSINEPIGRDKLSSIIGAKKKVAIACDDITRLTPNEVVLKPLLKEIRSYGVKKEDITLFIALGTHRDMNEQEIVQKFGKEIAEEYNIVNHNFKDLNKLEFFGYATEYLPVWINKPYLKHDVRIAIGGIIPHANAGWGAGGKTLLPGLAGEETVGKLHVHSAYTTPNALGLIENPTRHLINAYCEKINLEFIVNVVYNRDKQIVKSFAGHFVKAHREGIKESKKVYGVKIAEKSDITIVSSYPADIEFWQAWKGIASADLATKEGGGIVLITPCPEGIAVMHEDWADYLSYKPSEIKKMIENKEVEDYVAAGLALSVATMINRHKVFVISDGLSYKDAEKIGLKKYSSVEEAILDMKRIYGDDSKVHIMTHGGDTLPLI